MEIIYKAKDGTEFKNEYACQKYELDLTFKGLNCKLLDANMQPTNDPENVWHARFNSYKDIQAFNEFCDEQGVNGVECDIDETKPLAFYYDDSHSDEEGYHQYSEKIEELEDELSTVKNQYEKLLSI